MNNKTKNKINIKNNKNKIKIIKNNKNKIKNNKNNNNKIGS